MAGSNGNQVVKDKFRVDLLKYIDQFNSAVSTSGGDWVVKGFIDIFKNIYTVSADTKVILKIMELLLFPKICDFATQNQLKLVLSKEQNHYPDITFIDSEKNKFAVDIKSTYQKSASKVNGMTLGAFSGYFRNRTSTKNITFSYDEYIGHFVLGLIYSRSDENIDEREIFTMSNLEDIPSVVKDFQFFIHENYRLASDHPGSGNTKNIGSTNKLTDLLEGNGPFSDMGVEVFDDYWMYYLTKDDAKLVDLKKTSI